MVSALESGSAHGLSAAATCCSSSGVSGTIDRNVGVVEAKVSMKVHASSLSHELVNDQAFVEVSMGTYECMIIQVYGVRCASN